MNTTRFTQIFTCLSISIAFLVLSTAPASGAAASKILINIVEKQPVATSMGSGTQVNIINMGTQTAAETTTANAALAETILAKHLIQAKRQVVTSDSLGPGKKISGQEVAAAKTGNLPKLRKAAALSDAQVIFSAVIRTQITTGEVVGVNMSTSVTSISFKLVSTASGDILEIDSKTYKGADRSPELATHAAFNQMGRELSQLIAGKMSATVSDSDQNLLAQYKKQFQSKKKKPMTVAAVNKTAPTGSAMDKKSKAAVAKPKIIIIEPPMGRGFKTVEKRRSINVEGLAVDPVGIKSIKINGKSTEVDDEGRFRYNIDLKPGDNRLYIVVMNELGVVATKDIVLSHPEDNAPPEIILMEPHVSRGFAVVVREPAAKTNVVGMVKDDSEILFVRINGRDVTLSGEGRFSESIAFKPGQNAIVIDAMDKQGNRGRKEFLLAGADSGAKTVIPPPKGLKPALWGLAVGVSKYDSTAVDLKYADQDALSLAEFFKTQEGKLYSEVNFMTLINDEVTRDSVIENISGHLGKAAPDDVVFLFIAGHGIKHRQSGSYYFVPHDADYKTVLSKGLRMSDFEESVNILSQNVRKIVIAMDTCHSGALDVNMRATGSGEDLAKTLREASGRYILAASKAGEESLEDKRFASSSKVSGHGVFTYSLLEGMSGKANYDKDTYISLNELFQYVAKKVPRLTDGRQHPYFRTEGTDMPFVKLK
ncbi:MAG: caspase family protein [Deltaproteobacteria bacterium]|nr:caspase family protein [Deltaproteobacteria bacterium]